MRTVRTKVLLLSFITALAFGILPKMVKADHFYYTWDAATHGTNIYAPLGQLGSEVDAYADATGLTKVLAAGGIGIYGYVEAWAELYITLSGTGGYVKPLINYEVKGVRFNGGTATITLTCIDRATGITIGSWSKTLPGDAWDPITETLEGDIFEASSDREYFYWVKVYAKSGITLTGGILQDYFTHERHVKVNYLCIRETCTLNIQSSEGGTTIPAPGTYTYNYGFSVSVKAIPLVSEHYHFYCWKLDGTTIYDNPITVTMNSDHTLKAYFVRETSGGCPMLFVWDGADYAEEGILNIHAESDITVQHRIQNTLALENGVYKLQLRELDNYTSHIDQVKLYAVNYQGKWRLYPLTYAYHNELGKVTSKLFFDDSKRVDLTPTQTIDLKFLPSIPYSQTAYFIFEINGYNIKIP